MRKLTRQEKKEIKPILEKYRDHVLHSDSANFRKKTFHASLGSGTAIIGSAALFDPTGGLALFAFSSTAFNFLVARGAEKDQHATSLQNIAGQTFTGREDIVHCLQNIDAQMQEEAVYLELSLYTSDGETGNKHIQKMHELVADAQKLVPYVQLTSDIGRDLKFAIGYDANVDLEEPVFHDTFIDLFNKEAKKRQAESAAAKQANTPTTKSPHKIQKLKR